MTAAIIILAVFSVPLTAIVSSAWLKAKRLDAERKPAPEVEKRLALLEAKNAELRERVETLETIATGMDARQLGAEGAQELKELEQRLQTVTKKA
ncbi:MAG: hypothetical protein HYS27_26075 [Deltaproteobacteria bacterium]|nr:hypothetical protein [Deltaproteobacteria bacterium]